MAVAGSFSTGTTASGGKVEHSVCDWPGILTSCGIVEVRKAVKWSRGSHLEKSIHGTGY